MCVQLIQKSELFRKIVYKAGYIRAKDLVERIQPYQKSNDLILDIGAGSCNICEIFLNKGYDVIPLDVQNLSTVKNLQPVIYDGVKIPFNDNKFDKSLILTVLHHTREPESILREAKRVSKKIIIIEDVYDNWLQKYLTYFFDSLLNLEFIGHPRSNKSDEQWKKTFEKLGLKLIDVKYNYSFLGLRHATYYLEK